MLTWLVFILEFTILTSLIFGLHWVSPRIGLLPMLFVTMTLAVVISMSTFLSAYISIGSELTLGINGNLFVPLVILSLLLIYIINGSTLAQTTFASLLLVSVVTIMIVIAYAYYDMANAETAYASAHIQRLDIDLMELIRVRIASLSAFAVAMLGAVITYQAVRNLSRNFPEFVAVIAGFFIAMWLDSIIFFTISDFGFATFLSGLKNDLIVKTLISFVLAVPTSAYINNFNRKQPFSAPSYGRQIMGIVFNLQSQVTVGLQEMQNELQASQQIYRHLTQNLTDIIYLVEADTGSILYMSPAFENMTGHTESMVGYSIDYIQNFIHEDDRIAGSVLDFMLTKQSESFRYRRADGTFGWIKNRLHPLTNAQGEIYQYLGIGEDVTDEYLRREHEVQLKVSKERIKIMNDFMSDAAHDLKSPLSSLMLKIDMIKRVDGEKRKKAEDELRQRVLNLSKLIDDLFTLSIWEGSYNSRQKPVDLYLVMKTLVADLDAIAQGKSITVTIDTDQSDYMIMSTVDAMNRLGSNLISNAIRYTPENGSVSIHLSSTVDAVILQVVDTGIGIPEDKLDSIFDRYFRTENAKSFTRDGTGLGLAIIRAIIENHNGRIDVTSQVGAGSTFTVHLPRSNTK